MPERRLQITVNNDELYSTIMSISKAQRGQFVTMALDAYIKTDEGKHLVRSFAKHKPDQEKLRQEADQNKIAESCNLPKNSIMGDFE